MECEPRQPSDARSVHDAFSEPTPPAEARDMPPMRLPMPPMPPPPRVVPGEWKPMEQKSSSSETTSAWPSR